ncbi:MAG: CheR family methyltransferase [Nitrospirota bacterium]
MNNNHHGSIGNIHPASLPDKLFFRLSKLIHTECGIKMPIAKKTMLEARLQKRFRLLGMKSLREYCDYLFSPQGRDRELINMIDVVTTNKTDFFREPLHFDYLVQKALPELIEQYGAGTRRKLTVWSAGCSTGEEPYTLAMVLREFADRYQRLYYLILATDISTNVLEKARRGIYGQEKAELVPMPIKRKYFLKSKDRKKRLVRIVPELRAFVKFRRLNFMESNFEMREPMDIIFCRNVIIYFDRPTQERLLNRFCQHLISGGYIFMGHSETLNNMNVPLIQVSPTIYRKFE